MVGACYGQRWLGGVLSVERGYGGVLTFGGPLSSLTSQPSLFVVVVAAVDGDDGVHRHHQTSRR